MWIEILCVKVVRAAVGRHRILLVASQCPAVCAHVDTDWPIWMVLPVCLNQNPVLAGVLSHLEFHYVHPVVFNLGYLP